MDRSGAKMGFVLLKRLVLKCRKASVILVKETWNSVGFHSLRAWVVPTTHVVSVRMFPPINIVILLRLTGKVLSVRAEFS